MVVGTSSGAPVKVLVVDDSVLMQKLMTQIINSAPGFEVIGVAGSAEEGWDAIQELRPPGQWWRQRDRRSNGDRTVRVHA